MIQIKNASVTRELLIESYHPILIELVLWILQRYYNITITSGYREGDKGVHGTKPCRGLDIRSNGIKQYRGEIEITAGVICTKINSAWQYDPERPEKICAILHNSGSGMHIHLQCCKNTTML